MERQQTFLEKYNRICRDQNELYHAVVLRCGLSDCAFWLLYTLREMGTHLIQRELSAIVCQPKQTVHSALKKLEREGYVRMTEGRDRRSRYVALTERGQQLARRVIDPVLSAETEAFGCMSEEEQRLFLALLLRYNQTLRRNLHTALPDITTDGEDSQ